VVPYRTQALGLEPLSSQRAGDSTELVAGCHYFLSPSFGHYQIKLLGNRGACSPSVFMKAECSQQMSLHFILPTKPTRSTDKTIHLLLSGMGVLYVLNFGANRQVKQNMSIIIVFITANRQTTHPHHNQLF